MGTLLKYELKKIIKRPFTMVVAAGCLAVLLFVVGYSVQQANVAAWGVELYGSYEKIPKEQLERAQNNFGMNGEYDGVVLLHGLEALAQRKLDQNHLNGPWNNERLQTITAEYLANKNNQDNYDITKLDTWGLDMRKWKLIDSGMTEAEADAYNAANPIYQMKLEYQFGEWRRWDNISYLLENWVLHEDGTARPFAEVFPLVEEGAVYESHDGPRMATEVQEAMVGILAMLMLLAGVAPLFCEEVACHTEPMLLAARHGRGKLMYAKILAGGVFAFGSLLALSAVVFALCSLLYGASGWGMQTQLSGEMGLPFALTFWQLFLVQFGFQLLGLCAMAMVLMALSLWWRAALPVMFAGGIFVVADILFAAQCPTLWLKQLAQILPPGLGIPSLMLENATKPALTILPIPLWVAALVLNMILLLVCLFVVLAKTKNLRKT